MQRPYVPRSRHPHLHRVCAGHKAPVAAASATADRRSEIAATAEVRVTATLKGDLRTPPEDSPLWQSTIAHHGDPGYRDEWIWVTNVQVKNSQNIPGFSRRSAGDFGVMRAFAGVTLESLCAEPIGAQFITGADDVYVLPAHLARRSRIPGEYLRRYATGEDVRDWEVWPSALIIFPYDENLDSLAEPLPALT